MTRIAYSFSQNYHDGITWKIIDSWGGLPELRVKSESDSENRYVYLSYGDSFNYGHNIEYIPRPNW